MYNVVKLEQKAILKNCTRLARVPINLVEHSAYSTYNLMSPDFTMYFDVDYVGMEFVIRRTDDGSIQFSFPKAFINNDLSTQAKVIE
jgi:hypothetical protein